MSLDLVDLSSYRAVLYDIKLGPGTDFDELIGQKNMLVTLQFKYGGEPDNQLNYCVRCST